MTFPTRESFIKSKGWKTVDGAGEGLDFANDGEGMFWQFRVSVLPTQENLVKAFDALSSIQYLHNNMAHPLFKIINTQNDFKVWDAQLHDITDRDQRGKEICVYIPYDSKKKSFVFNKDYYKQFMLDIWKALEDNNVVYSYITPTKDEKEIEGVISPFFYSSFKPYTSPEGILFSDHYNPNNYEDPLEGITFTSNDLKHAGIKQHNAIQVSYQRIQYMTAHHNEGLERILTHLQVLLIKETKTPFLIEKIKNAENLTVEDDLNIIKLLEDLLKNSDEAFPTKLSKMKRVDIVSSGEIKHYLSEKGTPEQRLELVKRIAQQLQEENGKTLERLRIYTNALGITEEELEFLVNHHPYVMQSVWCKLIHLEHEMENIIREQTRLNTLAVRTIGCDTGLQDRWDKDEEKGELAQIKAVLENYTKKGPMGRFFKGNWNKHHTEEVSNIINRIDKGELRSIDSVLQELSNIEIENAEGSLSRHMNFLIAKSVVHMDKDFAPAAGNDVEANDNVIRVYKA